MQDFENTLHTEYYRQTGELPYASAGQYKYKYIKWLESMAKEFVWWKAATFVLLTTNAIFAMLVFGG